MSYHSEIQRMSISFRHACHLLIVALSVAVASFTALPCAHAGDFVVKVVDVQQKPVVDAVVTLTAATPAPLTPASEPVAIDQRNKEFTPRVTVITRGTRVAFPNTDDVQHHVYSFSTAKRFDLPLYRGNPSALVVFDTCGVVVLGCNIHDWMKAYIFVTDTPFFAKSGADGIATVRDLPGGDYQWQVWHPLLKQCKDRTLPAAVTVSAAPISETVTLELKRESRPARTPGAADAGYR